MLCVVSLDSYWACQSQQRAWWRGRLIDWNGLTDLRDCAFVPQIFAVWICRLSLDWILVPNSAIKQSEFEWLLEVQLCPQNSQFQSYWMAHGFWVWISTRTSSYKCTENPSKYLITMTVRGFYLRQNWNLGYTLSLTSPTLPPWPSDESVPPSSLSWPSDIYEQQLNSLSSVFSPSWTKMSPSASPLGLHTGPCPIKHWSTFREPLEYLIAKLLVRFPPEESSLRACKPLWKLNQNEVTEDYRGLVRNYGNTIWTFTVATCPEMLVFTVDKKARQLLGAGGKKSWKQKNKHNWALCKFKLPFCTLNLKVQRQLLALYVPELVHFALVERPQGDRASMNSLLLCVLCSLPKHSYWMLRWTGHSASGLTVGLNDLSGLFKP